MKRLLIAIDGPSGAGKGTLARTVADRLGYTHIDTGAMYRAIAWKALEEGVPLDNDRLVANLATRAQYQQIDGTITLDGHDITRAIRTPEIDRAAASVARLPNLRAELVRQQRDMGAGGAVVMEGRDIGTVVFPAADVKVYIDASAEERARRRAHDPAHTGSQSNIVSVQSDMAARDQSDSTRSTGPLAIADDAVYIDTTAMPIDSVVDTVMTLIKGKLG